MVREQRFEGERDMGTGESLSDPEEVRRLQTALHAKAKEAAGFRFYSLSDKVWRADVMAVAWQEVRRNGGAAGVDGQTVADIEAYGVDRWLGELAWDLKAGTYWPNAVRQALPGLSVFGDLNVKLDNNRSGADRKSQSSGLPIHIARKCRLPGQTLSSERDDMNLARTLPENETNYERSRRR